VDPFVVAPHQHFEQGRLPGEDATHHLFAARSNRTPANRPRRFEALTDDQQSQRASRRRDVDGLMWAKPGLELRP
jgi:hypothetical protein